MKKIVFLLLLCSTVLAQSPTDISDPVISIICGLYMALKVIGGGLGSLIFVYAGIKYLTEVDDPAARKRAKELMHIVVVGLIIVLLADSLVYYATVGGGVSGLDGCTVWCTILPC